MLIVFRFWLQSCLGKPGNLLCLECGNLLIRYSSVHKFHAIRWGFESGWHSEEYEPNIVKSFDLLKFYERNTTHAPFGRLCLQTEIFGLLQLTHSLEAVKLTLMLVKIGLLATELSQWRFWLNFSLRGIFVNLNPLMHSPLKFYQVFSGHRPFDLRYNWNFSLNSLINYERTVYRRFSQSQLNFEVKESKMKFPVNKAAKKHTI